MKVTIIGSGYVGLVSGVCLAHIGHEVVCVDKNEARIEDILRAIPPIYEPGLEPMLKDVLASGRFSATTNLAEALKDSDISMIAVGTPSSPQGIDLQFIRAAASEIGAHLKAIGRYHTVVVKSTVVPTTTQTVVKEEVEKASGMKAGQFGLAMNPEFLREGTAVDDFMKPDRIVVGGFDDRSAQAVEALYKPFTCPLLRTNLCNAEMIKYTTNALLATLVSYSNEITRICEHLPGASEATVMQGVWLDRRLRADQGGKVGHPEIVSYLRGGIGFGGSCLPKDVTALKCFAEAKGIPMPMLSSVLAVNKNRPQQIIESIAAQVGALSGKRIAVVGLAFKADTDDVRESPALRLVDALLSAGANVVAYDPIAAKNVQAIYGERMALAGSVEAACNKADAALIATSWPQFKELDWNAIAATMQNPVIFDGRQVIRFDSAKHRFRYWAVGIGPELKAA